MRQNYKKGRGTMKGTAHGGNLKKDRNWDRKIEQGRRVEKCDGTRKKKRQGYAERRKCASPQGEKKSLFVPLRSLLLLPKTRTLAKDPSLPWLRRARKTKAYSLK
jgi:hypothetical protein